MLNQKYTNEELFRMLSLLKSNYRISDVKVDKIMEDKNLSNEEKRIQLIQCESECINNTVNNIGVDTEFILGIQGLMSTFREGSEERDAVFYEYLTKYTSENITSLLDFIKSNLYYEFDHVIRNKHFIIKIENGDI